MLPITGRTSSRFRVSRGSCRSERVTRSRIPAKQQQPAGFTYRPFALGDSQLPQFELVPLFTPDAAVSSENSSVTFLPPKRIPFSEVEPSEFFCRTVASDAPFLSSSFMWAEAVATTSLPLRMLTLTSGPVPSHVTL